jgi:hypothetical protein
MAPLEKIKEEVDSNDEPHLSGSPDPDGHLSRSPAGEVEELLKKEEERIRSEISQSPGFSIVRKKPKKVTIKVT